MAAVTEWVLAPYEQDEPASLRYHLKGGRDREAARPGRTSLVMTVVAAAACAWLAFQVVMLGTVAIARVAVDGPTFAVVSGSMEPSIPVGSVVADGVVEPTMLKADDIISFRDPANEGQIITHRVVAIEDGQVITKGDANREADSTPVEPSSIVGQVKVVVPYVGLPTYWIKTRNYVPLGLWAVGTIAALAALVGYRRRPEDPVDDDWDLDQADSAYAEPAPADTLVETHDVAPDPTWRDEPDRSLRDDSVNERLFREEYFREADLPNEYQEPDYATERYASERYVHGRYPASSRERYVPDAYGWED